MLAFEWDRNKDIQNQAKHGISFEEAKQAFFDENKIIADDVQHSIDELRYYCFGRLNDKVMTVRFTRREERIRIIGAGYWREGRAVYDATHRK